SAPDAGVSRRYFDVGAAAGLGHAWRRGVYALRTELLGGWEQAFQDRGDRAARYSGGPTWLGLLTGSASTGGLPRALGAGAGRRARPPRGARALRAALAPPVGAPRRRRARRPLRRAPGARRGRHRAGRRRGRERRRAGPRRAAGRRRLPELPRAPRHGGGA